MPQIRPTDRYSEVRPLASVVIAACMATIGCRTFVPIHVNETAPLPISAATVPWDSTERVQFHVWAMRPTETLQRGRIPSGVLTDDQGVFQVDTIRYAWGERYLRADGNEHALPNYTWTVPKYQFGFGLDLVGEEFGLGLRYDIANASGVTTSSVTALLLFQERLSWTTVRADVGFFLRSSLYDESYVVGYSHFLYPSTYGDVEFDAASGSRRRHGVFTSLTLAIPLVRAGPDALVGGSWIYHQISPREAFQQFVVTAGLRLPLIGTTHGVIGVRMLHQARLRQRSPDLLIIPHLQLDLAL